MCEHESLFLLLVKVFYLTIKETVAYTTYYTFKSEAVL